MSIPDRSSALAVVRQVLAADFACSEESLQAERVSISTARSRPGGRRHVRPARFFEMVTLGDGVVIHCPSDRAPFLHEKLGHLNRGAIFSPETFAFLRAYVEQEGLELRGPTPNYVCSEHELIPADPPDSVEINFVEASDIPALYEHHRFTNALSYRADTGVPDMLATIAVSNREIVGMAGASADSEAMWQIGVDVLPEARLRGIGRALVSRLVEGVLHAGRVPYYAHNLTNVASAALAASVGFRQAWVEMYARERQRPLDQWEP